MLRSGYKIVPIALLALAIGLAMALPASAIVAVGEKAPDFKLEGLNGKDTVALSSYTDKPTIVVFWVSWCSHCRSELPVLEGIYKDLKTKGANVVGINVDDNTSDALAALNAAKVTFPNAFAGSRSGMETVNAYGVTAVPDVYVLDKGGKVASHYEGEVSGSTLRTDLAKLGVK